MPPLFEVRPDELEQSKLGAVSRDPETVHEPARFDVRLHGIVSRFGVVERDRGGNLVSTSLQLSELNRQSIDVGALRFRRLVVSVELVTTIVEQRPRQLALDRLDGCIQRFSVRIANATFPIRSGIHLVRQLQLDESSIRQIGEGGYIRGRVGSAGSESAGRTRDAGYGRNSV